MIQLTLSDAWLYIVKEQQCCNSFFSTFWFDCNKILVKHQNVHQFHAEYRKCNVVQR